MPEHDAEIVEPEVNPGEPQPVAGAADAVEAEPGGPELVAFESVESDVVASESVESDVAASESVASESAAASDVTAVAGDEASVVTEVVAEASVVAGAVGEPDAVLLQAHDLARAALIEITPDSTIGAPAGHIVEDGGVLSLLFENRMRGYPGWYWTVTIGRVGDEEPTVFEAELMPGEGALLAPDWVPWAERLAEYQAVQLVLEAERVAAGIDVASDDDVADGDGDDDDDADDDDDFEDLDAADFDSDGSPILHAGDVDGVDIDGLDEDEDSDDDDSDDDDSDDEDSDDEDSDDEDDDSDDEDDDSEDDDYDTEEELRGDA